MSMACGRRWALLLEAVTAVAWCWYLCAWCCRPVAALDSGEVCAYDAMKYILNHTERDLGEPEITAEQAADALPESLTALSSQLTAALTEGGSERLC